MPAITDSVQFVKGIGPKKVKLFEKLHISTLQDALETYPRDYEDRTHITRIADIADEDRYAVRAILGTEPKVSRIRKGMTLVKCTIFDESGSLSVTWFNQPYITAQLRVGQEYLFYGRVQGCGRARQMISPQAEKVAENDQNPGRIVPVYPLTAGVGQSLLHRAIRQGLDEGADRLPDLLPAELRRQHGLCDVRYAYENIHFPADDAALAAARRRLAFEELYFLTLGLRLLRARRTTVKGKTCAAVDMTPFFGALPFSLTGAQARAVDDILRDMTAERPMNRLVQGDVGSGKTMVAAAGIYFAAKNGLQAAFMAPTEILAEQHYHTLAPLLEKLGVRCALLTASTKAKTRRSILEQLAAGEIDLAIGTHALLSPDISYQNLGLVVTDEQHRFGVNQRAALGAKGENPHLLVMSATPIPRTLALMIYGDLDVSVIDELPPGRRSIETYAVPSSYHERIYAFLEKQLAEGRQAYIVCPMVEENGELPDERKAVTAYAEKLQKEVLPNRTVRFLHGKMKAKEKETIMRAFAAGEIDVLVSTTVVEVGVDVPNASVMLIENAECFGLSQLHQLRGRVGRGPWQSYCILVSDNRGEENKTRLDAMRRTQSGFALAEEDLKLRGPGDFFGARQHGLPTLRVADFACDMELLYEAQGAAEALLALDPRLEGHPALHARVRELFDLNAEALN